MSNNDLNWLANTERKSLSTYLARRLTLRHTLLLKPTYFSKVKAKKQRTSISVRHCRRMAFHPVSSILCSQIHPMVRAGKQTWNVWEGRVIFVILVLSSITQVILSSVSSPDPAMDN